MFLARVTDETSAAFRMLVGLLVLPGLKDVVCNGPAVWFADVGQGLRRLPNFRLTDYEVSALARFLVDLGERHLDIANPIADVALDCAKLTDDAEVGKVFTELLNADVKSLRVHAVLSSAVSTNTLLSIRIHRGSTHSLDVLAESAGWFDSQVAELQAIAQGRRNFLITGPSGSGKTTLLRAMLLEQPSLRTVVVEDTVELLPCGLGTVGLSVRTANLDGAGYIGLVELARQALRMRPDRLVVGEVRGPEVLALLGAMTTGHAGSAGTLHANSPKEVRARIAALTLESGLPESAAKDFPNAVERLIHLGADRSIAFIGALP